MGVDEPRGHQAAAQVLHLVHVHDVVDDPRNTLGQFSRGTDPGDPLVAGHDGGIAQDLGSGPQAADIGQQANCHRRSPTSPPGLAISRAMNVHLL